MDRQLNGPPPPIRVIVRLPYNRPEESTPDPPAVEWNTEKENILWEVIARSRSADSAGTDWKGLAAHLEVPLPYLLFRAQARYEQDLRGLQGIHTGTNLLSPTSPSRPEDMFPIKPLIRRKVSDSPTEMVKLKELHRSDVPSVPSGRRGRVPSFGANTSLGGLRKVATSSTITLRGHAASSRAVATLDPPSPSTSGSDSDSEDDEARRAEEAGKEQENQAELTRKLHALETALTADTLGLIRSPAPRSGDSSINGASATSNGDRRGRRNSFTGSGRQALADSLRMAPLALNIGPGMGQGHAAGLQTPSSRSASLSSAANSPPGSIPSIPSPPPESIASSQGSHGRPRRHTHSQPKSTSPPTLSPRSNRGQMRYQTLAGGVGVNEQGSAHGSSASSFSDISDLSLSSSANESGLGSHIRGSRMPSTGRSHLHGRSGRG